MTACCKYEKNEKERVDTMQEKLSQALTGNSFNNCTRATPSLIQGIVSRASVSIPPSTKH